MDKEARKGVQGNRPHLWLPQAAITTYDGRGMAPKNRAAGFEWPFSREIGKGLLKAKHPPKNSNLVHDFLTANLDSPSAPVSALENEISGAMIYVEQTLAARSGARGARRCRDAGAAALERPDTSQPITWPSGGRIAWAWIIKLAN